MDEKANCGNVVWKEVRPNHGQTLHVHGISRALLPIEVVAIETVALATELLWSGSRPGNLNQSLDGVGLALDSD